jgi:hypothetical protein
MKGNILNHFQVKLPGSKTIILQGTSISMMWQLKPAKYVGRFGYHLEYQLHQN